MRAVVVTPLTGPLARFGRDGAQALALWATRVAVPSVHLEVKDAHPNAAEAMRVAVADQPDIVFGPYGSGPAVAAVRATRRLVWNHGGATTRLGWASTPNAVNVPAPATVYHHGAVQAIHGAGGSVADVAILHSRTRFGRDVGQGAAAEASRLGWAVRTAAFRRGEAAAPARTLPSAEVMVLAGGWEDELAAARVLLPRPWRAAAMVAAGEEGLLTPLGAAREGLLGPAQWLATAASEPALGPPAAWFVEAFRTRTGHDPSYPAAQAFAAGLVAAHCLSLAGGSDDAAVRDAALATDTTTMFGRFRLDPVTGLQAGHRMLTVQWQNGVRRVVWPPQHAEATLRLAP
jgi:branched-chain amino acid transport system substrate-binding protein